MKFLIIFSLFRALLDAGKFTGRILGMKLLFVFFSFLRHFAGKFLSSHYSTNGFGGNPSAQKALDAWLTFGDFPRVSWVRRTIFGIAPRLVRRGFFRPKNELVNENVRWQIESGLGFGGYVLLKSLHNFPFWNLSVFAAFFYCCLKNDFSRTWCHRGMKMSSDKSRVHERWRVS